MLIASTSRAGTERFRCDKTRSILLRSPTRRAATSRRQSLTDPPNAILRTLGDALPNAKPGEATVASTRAPGATSPIRPLGASDQKRPVKAAQGRHRPVVHAYAAELRGGTRAAISRYPLDYASASTAGQISGWSRCSRGGPLPPAAAVRYAIIDNAAFLIVGDRRISDTHSTARRRRTRGRRQGRRTRGRRSRSHRCHRAQPRQDDDREPHRAQRPVPRGRDERRV